jgi:hypothetical protein
MLYISVILGQTETYEESFFYAIRMIKDHKVSHPWLPLVYDQIP